MKSVCKNFKNKFLYQFFNNLAHQKQCKLFLSISILLFTLRMHHDKSYYVKQNVDRQDDLPEISEDLFELI